MIRARYLTWLSATAIIVSWLAAVACGQRHYSFKKIGIGGGSRSYIIHPLPKDKSVDWEAWAQRYREKQEAERKRIKGLFVGIVNVPVLRQVSETGLLGELASRMPASWAARYHEDPKTEAVGCGHYYAHGLNSWIRNQYGGTDTVNASYMPGGKALVLPEPTQTTLREVFARSRHEAPNRILHIEESLRDWNHQPLYLLDELSAYCNGTTAGIEAGQLQKACRSSGCAYDALGYSRTMARLVRARGYKHADELDWFLDGTEEFLKTLEPHLSGRQEHKP